MKRLFLLFSICFAGILLSSCSDKEETLTSDELIGTVWSQTTEGRTDTFYFALNRKCTAEWKYENSDPVRQEYRYSYKAPNVTIETSANMFTGRIDGDVLSIHIFDRDLTLKKVR